MKILPAHVLLPRSVSGISAATLLGALALSFVVEGLSVSVVATASPASEVQPTRSWRAMCEECGVVDAARRIAQSDGEKMATAVTQYEVVVRMRDGSIRTFIEASSVHWRPGERIILIGDAGQASN